MKLAKTVEIAFFLIYANGYDFFRFCRKKNPYFFSKKWIDGCWFVYGRHSEHFIGFFPQSEKSDAREETLLAKIEIIRGQKPIFS